MNHLLKSYIKPFNENEVTPLVKIDLYAEKDKLEMLEDIIRHIERTEYRKEMHIEAVYGYSGTFPELRENRVHDIDICNRVINRLWERYNRILKS